MTFVALVSYNTISNSIHVSDILIHVPLALDVSDVIGVFSPRTRAGERSDDHKGEEVQPLRNQSKQQNDIPLTSTNKVQLPLLSTLTAWYLMLK